MTFERFKELLNSKYPEAKCFSHGKSGKVTIVYKNPGKNYDYYGSYEEVLNKVGIKVISKWHLQEIENQLKHYSNEHGKPNIFFQDQINDFSENIKYWSDVIKDIKENYIIL